MKPFAKRSKGLRILAAVGGLAIAAGLALTVDALHGDPLSRAPGHCPGGKALPGSELHRAGQLGRHFF